MALNIFGQSETGEAAVPQRRKFADDVVGRFRSGHTVNNRPAALSEWRVTTGDPEVAAEIHDALGGDAPQEWAAKGEDKLEVFTATKDLDIIIDGPKALRQKMVLWSRAGKLVQSGDGQFLDDGTPDPDAELTFAERKQKARDGIGAEPQIEVYFRIVGAEDLGIFKFQTGSWGMASDLAYNGVEEELAEIDGPTLATLSLEEVSFTAKNGPRAGQNVTYTKPVLAIKGAATEVPAAA